MAQPLRRAWLDGSEEEHRSTTSLQDPLSCFALLDAGRVSSAYSEYNEDESDTLPIPNNHGRLGGSCCSLDGAAVEDNMAIRKPLLEAEASSSATTNGHELRQRHAGFIPPLPSRTTQAIATSTTTHNPPQHQRRLLDRDAAFLQSRGRWRIQHISEHAARMFHRSSNQDDDDDRVMNGNSNNTNNEMSSGANSDSDDDDINNSNNSSNNNVGGYYRRSFLREFWGSWFYTLAYQRTAVLMLILFGCYSTIVVMFASIHWSVSRFGAQLHREPSGTLPLESPIGTNMTHTVSDLHLFCDMGINHPREALFFSLSTMASIGYGVSDYYFGECWIPFVLVTCQVCCAITFDAVAIGLLFQRISRGHKRGKTVLFSSRAVIHRVRGIPYLFIRVAELRRYSLLGATVRAYCVRHERHAVHTGTRTTATTNPAVTDAPPATTIETTHYVTKSMQLLYDDGNIGSSQHILMSLPQVLVHRIDDKSPLRPPSTWYDRDGRRHCYSPPTVSRETTGDESCDTDAQRLVCLKVDTDEMKRYLLDNETEIVFIVEGTDELTGITSQTRHSYTAKVDFAWNQRFVPCTFPYIPPPAPHQTMTSLSHGLLPTFSSPSRRRHRRNGPPACVTDFSRFHETETAVGDYATSPYVV